MRNSWHLLRRTVYSRPEHFASLSLIVFFAIAYIVLASSEPYGGVDAMAIWNLRARFFAYAPDIRDAFDPTMASWSHLDYPPLLPAVIALGWRLFGDTVYVPIAIHGITFVATLWFFRKYWWAVAIMGATTIQYGIYQMADLPLALAFLAAAAAHFRRREMWMGIALGIGSLIKNEGLLILTAFFIVWVFRERCIPYRALLAALPFIVMVIAFKWWVGIPNDVMSAPGALARLFTLSRHLIIGLASLVGLLAFGNGAFLVLGLCLWLARIRPSVSVSLITVMVVFLGYVAIYTITPHDLIWHLTTSYERLLLHLFPTFVYSLIFGQKQLLGRI